MVRRLSLAGIVAWRWEKATSMSRASPRDASRDLAARTGRVQPVAVAGNCLGKLVGGCGAQTPNHNTLRLHSLSRPPILLQALRVVNAPFLPSISRSRFQRTVTP